MRYLVLSAALLLTMMLTGCTSTSTPPVIERSGDVRVGDIPVVLLGRSPEVGETAPDFRVVDATFKPVKLSDFKDRAVLISVVPSLDTGVCSLQTKRFNAEAAKLAPMTQVITISMDLPFAQKRFCQDLKNSGMLVLSDSVWREFGTKYGLMVKDRGFLARSVWVIGRDGRIVYRQIVPQLGSEPDYRQAVKAAWNAM